MAQVIDTQAAGKQKILASNLAVSVAQTGNTTLLELNTVGAEKLSVQLLVSTQALDAFVIQGKTHPDAAYITLYNTAAAFTSPSGRILAASGDLTTLAAAATGWFDMDVSGLYSVKILASGGNATPSVVDIYASAGDAAGAPSANINATITTGDVEIGAVEIKNATTDTRAIVLAASTAAAATDTPLVVALHPSSPLGAGTAAIGKLAANSGVDIGDVDILSIAAGDNNIGNVDVVTLPALAAGSATIGAVTGSTADNAANPILKLGVLPAVALAAAPTRTEGNVNPLRLNLAGDVAITLDGETVVLGAGTAEIGKLAAGTANIGDVDVLTLPALVAGTANIGDVDVLTIAAGDNNIGNVDIVTLPALVAGSATIGAVTGPTADNAANPTLKLSVLSGVALAAAPTRTEGNVNPLRLNLAGDAAVTLDGEAVVLGAGTAEIGKLAAGTANIGDVDVLTLPALVAGSAIIGKVGVDQTTPGTTNGVEPANASVAASTANEASRVVKASAGSLYGITGYNAKTADQFIQVHNTTTVPADTAVPIITFIARASSNFSWDSGNSAYPFSTGITLSNSSTQATKTIGAADCWFNVTYR